MHGSLSHKLCVRDRGTGGGVEPCGQCAARLLPLHDAETRRQLTARSKPVSTVVSSASTPRLEKLLIRRGLPFVAIFQDVYKYLTHYYLP